MRGVRVLVVDAVRVDKDVERERDGDWDCGGTSDCERLRFAAEF